MGCSHYLLPTDGDTGLCAECRQHDTDETDEEQAVAELEELEERTSEGMRDRQVAQRCSGLPRPPWRQQSHSAGSGSGDRGPTAGERVTPSQGSAEGTTVRVDLARMIIFAGGEEPIDPVPVSTDTEEDRDMDLSFEAEDPRDRAANREPFRTSEEALDG